MASAVVDSMSTRFNPSSGEVQGSVFCINGRSWSHVSEDAIGDESAYFLTAIARTDYLSGNTSYQNLVLDNVKAHFQTTTAIANSK